MDMKKFRILMSLILSLCVLVISASAAVIDSAIYNTKTNTVTIKGNMQSSGNIISDPECKDASAWSKASTGTISATEDGIRVSDRKNYYDGIRQNIYNQVSKYGNGTYRLSGEIKAFDKTVSADTKGNSDSVAPVTFTKEPIFPGIYINTSTKSFTVSSVGSDWVSFSGSITISDVTEFIADKCFINIVSGTVDAKDEDGNVLVGTDGKNRKIGDTRDFCVRNMSLEYIEGNGLYKGVEKIGIAVTNGSDALVYANERETDENGNYAISFQLPEVADASNLKARVNGKNTVAPVQKGILTASVDEKITLTSVNNKTRVSFDIFDFIDSSNYSDITAIAASYNPDGALYDVSRLPIEITNDAEVTQYVDVEPPNGNGCVKLFLFDKLNAIAPICKVHSGKESKTLFLVGDSICVAYKNANQVPQAGWGQYIGNYLADEITVENCAHGGYSTASFMVYDTYRGAYGGAHSWNSETIVGSDGKTRATNPILPNIKSGDYVMVSLGINDNASNQIGTTEDEYRTFLTQMANDVRAKGAEIIFVTPTITSAQPYQLSVPKRVEIMTDVADELGAVCLPLGAELVKIYENTPRDTVEHYNLYQKWLTASIDEGGFGLTAEDISNHSNAIVKAGKDDRTHLTYMGAELVAKTIADLLKTTECRGNLSSLAGYVKN